MRGWGLGCPLRRPRPSYGNLQNWGASEQPVQKYIYHQRGQGRGRSIIKRQDKGLESLWCLKPRKASVEKRLLSVACQPCRQSQKGLTRDTLNIDVNCFVAVSNFAERSFHFVTPGQHLLGVF